MVNLTILEGLFETSLDDYNIIHLGPSQQLVNLCSVYYAYLIDLLEQSCQNVIKLTKAFNFKLSQSEFIFKVQELLRKELFEVICIKEPLLRLGVFQYAY